MSRTKRATWTYGTNVIFTLVTMVTGLYASPRITAWIGGAKPFGYYRAASDLGGFIPLLELGLSGGIMALLSRAIGQGDHAEIRATLAAGIRLAGRVCLLMLLVGWALVFVFPYLKSKHGLPLIGPEYLRDVQIGFALSVLGCLTFPLQPFRALMEARQRGYLVNALVITQTLLMTGLALLFAYSGGGIAGQFLAYLLGTLLVPLVIAWQGLRLYPGVIREAATRPIPGELSRSLSSLNHASMVLNICGRLSIYTDSLFIVSIVGEDAVAWVYLTSRLADMAKNQLLAVGSSTWAGLAEIRLRGDLDHFARRLCEVNRLLALLGMTALLPIAAYNSAFMGLWFNKIPMYAGDAVTLVIAANALLLPFAALWGWMFQGMGRTPRLVRATIISTVLNITISIAATWTLGMVGPLVGTLAAFVLYQSWRLPLLLREEFDVSLGGMARAIVPPFILGVPVGFLLWGFARAFPPHGWLDLALRMGSMALIYPILAWFLVLGGEERETWLGRMRPLLARFRPVPDVPPLGHPETRADGGVIDVEGTETADPDDEPAATGPAR